jgi:hypothetical protein
MDNQDIISQDQKVSSNNKEECCNEETPTNHPELGNMLSNLDELFKGNDDFINNFKNIDMTEMQNNMTMMMQTLQKSGDPNILSMLNLMNNLSISNLTNSQFSLGDNVQNDFSNEKLVEGNSDTSDTSDEENLDEYEKAEDEESEESEPDEDLLSYLKDKEENQDMILNVKKMLENMNGSNN